MNRSIFYSAAFALALVAFASTAGAATFVVDSTLDVQDATPGDGICATAGAVCTLRAAITEANALAGADIITLPAGTYTTTLAGSSENNNVSGDFDLNSEITINGAGSSTTIVQADVAPGVALERVFHLRAAFAMQLNDLTIRHGRYTTAAGTFGAGVRVDTAAVIATFNRVVIANNENGTSGGGLAISGANNSVTTLNDCRVENNSAGGTLAGSSSGAGIMLNTASATLNINNSSITGNTVSNTSTTVGASGGGMSSIGTLNITDSVVANNIATSSGSNTFSGGVHVTAGTTSILRSSISGNASTVTAGAGNGFAGGLYNQQATVTLTDSILSGNSASSFHGGIRALGQTVATTTNIVNSTISNNTAVGEGGGIINFSVGAAAATVNISGSTISGNSASGATAAAGGLENVATSTGLAVMNVSNSTVSGNSAADAAGTFNTGANATINFNFSTIAGNTATGAGGGIFQDATGATNLRNSIVADNSATTGPDISGTVSSLGWNHIEDVSGGTFGIVSGDITGSDPQLGALANNGGTTLTHLPALTSPVLNIIPNGTNDCGTAITTSQTGVVRPQQAGCEKGSVEIGAFTVGGNVTGLVGTGLVLRNNGGDDLPIAGNGMFTFATPVATGGVYAVSVFSNPTGPVQTCSVTMGSGTVGTANVTDVAVTCATASADIAATLTDSPDPVTAGSNLTYVATATNNGPSAADTVTTSLPLPANTTFVSATPSAGSSCTLPTVGANGTVACSWAGSTASAAARSVTVVAAVNIAASGTLSATLTAGSSTGDPTPGNNMAVATTAIGVPSADVAVTLTDSPDPVTPGSNLSYVATLTNNGPGTAQDIAVSLPMPTGTGFVSATPGAGGTCTTPPVGASGTIACNWTGATAAAAVRVLNAVVSVPASATGTLNATATGSSTSPDGNAANNTANASTVVGVSADLALTLTASPAQVSPGSPISFVASVINNGPSAAQNVQISVALNPGVQFNGATSSAGGTCTTPAVGTSGTVVCTFSGATASGATRSVTVTAFSLTSGSAGASATASSATTDPTPANNAASGSVIVAGAGTGPTLIPTASGSVLALLAALMGMIGFAAVRRRV